jgi:2-hydroxy-4-carboxymuconate semialdehyde hemiacetal dehydrogenase
MIGHGMMGTWHSEALKHHPGVALHTLVGIEAGPADEFARRYGYKQSTTDLMAAIHDPATDAVIVAGPSESHARMALEVIKAGKPVLVEIPIGMTLEAAEAVVSAAERAGVPLAVSHPMRFRTDRHDLLTRIRSGEEIPRHVHGRFFIHRLANIGATGIKRSWTDNILWHHTTHLLDFGLWLIGGGDPEAAERRIRRIQSFMPGLDPQTGIPMEVMVSIETEDDQTIVATGSYYGRYRIYDVLAVTDRDSYGVDELTATMTTGAGSRPIPTEQENASLIARDFIDALNEGRPPLVTGRSVLPVMRVLDRVQAEWDGRFSARSIPGRPLDQLAVPIT